MKVGFLGGANCHALAIARYFYSLGIDCFGIGRGPQKHAALFLAPPGYRYYCAPIGEQNDRVVNIINLERPQVLINFCAQGEGAASFGKEAPFFYQTNCVYLAHLVEDLKSCESLNRFIHIGTSELYGSCGIPVTEDAPLKPSSPYAVSKAAFDQHLLIEYRTHRFPAIIVRPSNAYCPGQQLQRILPRACISAVYDQKLTLRGGEARKSYLHTEDLARAVLVLLDKGMLGEIYNVGPDEPIAIRALVEIVKDASGRLEIDHQPQRLGEDGCYWLSSDKIKSLGWKPTISLKDGIREMLDWVWSFPELAAMPHEYQLTP